MNNENDYYGELCFDPITTTPEETEQKLTMEQRFERFHANNPAVYSNLVKLARDCRRNRPERVIGIQMLFEVLRWNYFINVNSEEEYKFPNEFAAGYSRLIMKQEQDLDGIFKINKSRFDQQ
jgi:hypothetical protein